VASQQERADRFRALHEGDPFLIPNPWDAGAARVLEGLGFQALASTSSGFAFTLGRPDGGATLDEVIEHTRVLAAATTLPLSVDLEDGHRDPASAIVRVAEAGAVGGSVEAAERVAAAVEAAAGLGFPFTLTARAENHIHGRPDLGDTIARLQAYERAGADVLYAPGLREAGEVRAICEAVSKPVNVLAHAGLSMADVVEAGAQRISVGGALTWVAAAAMAEAAKELLEGDFSALRGQGELRGYLAE